MKYEHTDQIFIFISTKIEKQIFLQFDEFSFKNFQIPKVVIFFLLVKLLIEFRDGNL